MSSAFRQYPEKLSAVFVGKVSVGGEYAALEHIGIGPCHKHRHVMVGFDDAFINTQETIDKLGLYMSDVRSNTDFVYGVAHWKFHSVSDTASGVVRSDKRTNVHISHSYREVGRIQMKHGKKRGILVFNERTRRKLRHINGNCELLGNNFQTASVIDMLVRYKYRGYVAKRCSYLLERVFYGAGGNARVDKYLCIF